MKFVLLKSYRIVRVFGVHGLVFKMCYIAEWP